MIELALHFIPKPKVINFPTEWEELTAPQVEAYCRYVYPYRQQVFEVLDNQLYIKEFREPQFIEICRAMLFSIIGIKLNQFNKIHNKIIKQLIFEEKILHFLFLEYNLWVNPMPEIVKPSFAYYGPVSGFAEISLSEFLDADEAYRSYLANSEVTELNHFVAILYREKSADFNPKSPSTNGDCREPYNDLTVKFRVDNIAKLSLTKKLAVFIWFESCKNFITEKYEVIFKSSGQTESQADAIDPILQISRNALNYNQFKNLPVMLIFEDIKKQNLESEKIKNSIKPVG
jgi:hypothetical protein